MRSHFFAFLVLCIAGLCSCAAHTDQAMRTEPPSPEKAGFISSLFKTVGDTERGAYDLLYGIRDEVDSMVYDAQKNYYGEYQK